MATSPIIAVSREDRRKRRRSRLLSCFGPPAVLDSAAAQAKTSPSKWRQKKPPPPPGFRWSRFRAEKTVPVDVTAIADTSPATSEAVMALADDAGRAPEEDKSKKSSLFRRLTQKRSQKLDHNIRPNHHQHVQQPEIPDHPNGTEDGLHHVASMCRTRVEPAPLYRMNDRTRIGTRTSHPGLPVAGHGAALAGRRQRVEGEGGSGIFVLTVALAMLLMGSLIWATTCMCAWFYLVSQAKQPLLTPEATISDDEGRDEVDVSSKEHKKKVVLQGLLQRDGRRTSRINNFSSTM